MDRYIAHMIPEYLGHTLNWVHTQIKYTKEFKHYVMTGKTLNLDCYPVDRVYNPAIPANPREPVERLFRRLGIFPSNAGFVSQKRLEHRGLH